MRNALANWALLLVVLATGPAAAKDWYISSTGSGGGASCSDTKGFSFFNSLANWGVGASQISPGDTVHVCGTNTMSSAAPFLAFQGNGAAGNYITLLFETDAVMQAATWSGNAIDTNKKSYVIVDGGKNGLVQTTDNGTKSGIPGATQTFSNQGNAIGVGIGSPATGAPPGGSHVIVRNLTIGPMYARTSINDDSAHGGNTGGSAGIEGFFGGGAGDSDVQIYNNVIHDAQLCMEVAFEGGTTGSPALSNVQVYGNTTSRCATDLVFGSGNNDSHAAAISLHDNDLSDGYAWDSSDDTFHCDGFHVWANDFTSSTASTIAGLKIYNNYIHGKWGVYTTSRIYVEALDNNATAITTPLIYNNIMDNTAAGTVQPADGYIYTKGTSAAGVYNNTIVGMGVLDNAFNTLWLVSPTNYENNIVSQTHSVYYAESSDAWGTRDYNDYFNSNQAPIGAHDVTGNPLLNPGYQLDAGSSAIGAGVNLSTEFTTDKNGFARATSGPWDLGAYAFGSVWMDGGSVAGSDAGTSPGADAGLLPDGGSAPFQRSQSALSGCGCGASGFSVCATTLLALFPWLMVRRWRRNA